MATDLREIWFENHGVTLFAVESGRSKPIIFLHGGLANHLACRVFAAPLAARFRLITPDLRAAGRSIYAGELSWRELADDVAALVRHLGLDRAVIGGVSFGAGCAVRVALDHPELVEGLVVMTPAYGGADVGLTAAQQAAMHAMDAFGSRAVAEGIEMLFPLFDALPPAIRDRGRAVIATFDPASVAATTRFMASGAQPLPTAAALATIDAPTLLIPGNDPTHPPEISDLYRRHLRRCTVREITASVWSGDGEYAAAIADFIDRLQ